MLIKSRKDELSLKFKVERSNDLNQLSPKGMCLTEIRFLAIYQAKINARNPNSRTVTFPLAEFCNVMEIKQLTVTHIKKVADGIICKPVHLPSENGKNGFIAIPLFNECEVYQDDYTSEWFVKIECHPKVVPFMFEMRRNYFTYELWNALKLTSVNQIRMYEILKQYEKIGERIIELDELKYMLGIDKQQYELFKNFRIRVLESCQIALSENTDISYTFEPIRKSRRIVALKFTITKNKNFKDDLKLREFIKPEDLYDLIDVHNGSKDSEATAEDTPIQSLYWRCDKAYTMEQLEMLYNYVESLGVRLNVNTENYIYSIYYKIKIEGNKVNNIFKYTFAIMEKQINEYIFASSKIKKASQDEEVSMEIPPSYDLEEWKKHVESDEQIMYYDE